jgi:hypothetical protein
MVVHAGLSAVIGCGLAHIAEQSAAAVEAGDTIGWSGTRPGAGQPPQPCTAPRESCVRSETEPRRQGVCVSAARPPKPICN